MLYDEKWDTRTYIREPLLETLRRILKLLFALGDLQFTPRP